MAIISSGTSVVDRRLLAALGLELHLPGDWITVSLLDARLTAEGGGWVEAGIWACCSGTMGTSRKPGLCSLKWADLCLASPGLFIRDIGGGVGLSFLLISCVPSPELSVGDVGKGAGGEVVLTLCFAVGRVGGSMRSVASTVCSLVMSLELSVEDMEAAVMGVRLAPELAVGEVEICALARRSAFNTATFVVICRGSGRWSKAALIYRFSRSQGWGQ